MHLEPGVMLAGLLVGFVVGLTGMGGGALMTPILVLVFRINPVPHGRVVRVLASVNGRRVASLRGRRLSAVATTAT